MADDSLWRMVWALPLVLALGVAAMLALKRLLPAARGAAGAAPLALRQSLRLSDAAQLHLVSVDGQSVLVVESGGAPTVHVLPSAAPAAPFGSLARRARP